MTHTAAGHAVGLSHCPNCGRRLEGAFCATGGQKAAPLNPTLHDFLHDFTHELLHVDGKIFQSVRLLLLRPGFLSREWFEGRRARYISPIRLYLIFSVAFFAVSAIGESMDLNITVRDREELGREITTDPREIASRVRHWIPRAMFVLVPVFALLVSAVTGATGRNYPQDLYFALHTHAAIFGVAAMGQLLKASGVRVGEVVDVLVTAYAAWYLVVALRTAYGGSVRRTVGRAAVVGILYGFAIIMTVVIVALIAVFV